MSHLKKYIEDKIEKKILTMTMSDKSKWEIPVYAIILHRIESQMNEPNIVRTFHEEAFKAVELFKNERNLMNWCFTFMKWDDVKDVVKRVDPVLDFDSEWLNSEKTLS